MRSLKENLELQKKKKKNFGLPYKYCIKEKFFCYGHGI